MNFLMMLLVQIRSHDMVLRPFTSNYALRYSIHASGEIAQLDLTGLNPL